MSKRVHEGTSNDDSSKRRRTGFQVGPANLPDGTYKRKVQKIKQNLIHKAQLKKDLARAKEEVNQTATLPIDDDAEQATNAAEIHPDRQAMMDAPEPVPQNDRPVRSFEPRKPQSRRLKHNPLEKEANEAQRRKEETEARQNAREEGERERNRKIDERNRLRKAMDKARQPGKNGQRRLGRESVVLLERVKKLMDKT